MQAIETEIRQFVVDNFLFGRDEPKLGPEDSFLDAGVIDSTGVLELVSFLERHFGIQVDDADLVPENLDSIAGIVRYVSGKRPAVAQA